VGGELQWDQKISSYQVAGKKCGWEKKETDELNWTYLWVAVGSRGGGEITESLLTTYYLLKDRGKKKRGELSLKKKEIQRGKKGSLVGGVQLDGEDIWSRPLSDLGEGHFAEEVPFRWR